MPSEISRSILWVIIEVNEVDGTIEVFPEPGTLHVPPGFTGNIFWYVFTPGWELHPDHGVTFDPGATFDGVPSPDPVRAGCWSTATSNYKPGSWRYHVAVRRKGDLTDATVATVDPVVENDPPPTPAPPPGEATDLRSRPRGHA